LEGGVQSVRSRLFGRSRRHDPLARLTPRERELLALISEGRTNVGIARQLWLNAALSRRT
jgi:DNA-binding CsgD family transcriptional regulator